MGEGFRDEDARAAWDAGARAWEHFVDSGADHYRHAVHGPGLLAACGPVGGVAALDLGCGHGYFSRELARRGARVVGVDLCGPLIAAAIAHERREPLGISYYNLSAADVGGRWPEGAFGLITACMAVQDMADVPATLRAAWRVLPAGGRFVFSVPHPCTDTPLREWERDAGGEKIALRLAGYFTAGPTTCAWNMPRLLYPWATPYWRFTLTRWSDMIADAGFAIRRLHEPRPTDEEARRRPELRDCLLMPFFLVFDLVKGS